MQTYVVARDGHFEHLIYVLFIDIIIRLKVYVVREK